MRAASYSQLRLVATLTAAAVSIPAAPACLSGLWTTRTTGSKCGFRPLRLYRGYVKPSNLWKKKQFLILFGSSLSFAMGS